MPKKKKDYTFYYLDRIEKKEKKIKGRDIIKIDGDFIVIEKLNPEGVLETAEIPMHRIRSVKKNNSIVWKRK
ncbi:MAG: DUF504 domain-containing protein [Nanoarchaeota archaeon]|nr:DUF504 domain-containing protein [Nanoarchaeota archaeon]